MRVPWRTVLWLLLASSLLSACGHYGRYSPAFAPSGSLARGDQTPPAYHVVVQGDTLYSIAWGYGLDYRTVASWNAILPPYTIYPGQHIRFSPPDTRRRVAAPASPPAHRHAVAPPPTQRTSAPAPRVAVTRRGPVRWQWPTQGTVISGFSADQAGKKGLDIAGKLGQPVYAAAAGRVVYSGSGLIGYGKLIIINHNDTYLSAYAHNSRLLVSENQEVKKGQHIADMGDSGADRVMLHFEIRRNGKPVDPMKYLPRQR